MIHDAAALRHPGWYSRAYAAWQRRCCPRIARRARRVVTVSEFSRSELRELLGVDAAVVPGGVDERFTPDADPEPARRALGLARPYVLCVASQTARKNLAALAGAAPAGVEVVVAGGHRPQFAAERGLGAPPPARPRRRRAAPRPLRRRARRSSCPRSTRASACRCWRRWPAARPCWPPPPGALPETCGDAARLVEPDPEAIRAGLRELLADPGRPARARPRPRPCVQLGAHRARGRRDGAGGDEPRTRRGRGAAGPGGAGGAGAAPGPARARRRAPRPPRSGRRARSAGRSGRRSRCRAPPARRRG